MYAKLGLLIDIIGVILISIDMLKIEIQMKIYGYFKSADSISFDKLLSKDRLSEEDLKAHNTLFVIGSVFLMVTFLICQISGVVNENTIREIDYYVMVVFNGLFCWILVYGIIQLLVYKFQVLQSFNKILRLATYMIIPILYIYLIVFTLFSLFSKIFINIINKLEQLYFKEQSLRIFGLLLLIIGFMLQFISLL